MTPTDIRDTVIPEEDRHRPRYSTNRMRSEIAWAKAYARHEALEEAAKIAECHSDGCFAAIAIRALAKIAARDLR